MVTLAKFKDLGLSDNMVEALRQKGFEEPTPIQILTIPYLLKGTKDIVGQAQTGTGKTGAFGIPLIENITPKSGKIKALVLAPTRELAIQVMEEINSLCLDKQTKVIPIYGGQPIERQIERIKRGVDIVVGTPGRVLDHLNRKTLNFSDVDYVVLDEADEMLNMGFIDDIESILKQTQKEKRMLLFSATMPKNIMHLAKKYMGEYEVIKVARDEIAKKNIQQIYFEVNQADKFEALYRIIDVEEEFYGVVFCRTKLDAEDIANKLSNRGSRAEALHGDVSQGQRERILQKFKNKKLTVLVATDVAARGIDVNNLTHVINYSIPQDPESYVHRIGRTGRAGKEGTAITLVTSSEYRKLLNIKKVANADIEKQQIPNVKEVIKSKKEKIKSSVTKIIESGHFEDLNEIAGEILEGNDAKTAIAALLKYAFKDKLTESNYSEISSYGDRSRVDRKGTARLFVAKGKKDGMSKDGLAKFIEKQSGVNSHHINDIKILDSFSFVAVPFKDAETIIESFKKGKGRSLVSKAKNIKNKRN